MKKIPLRRCVVTKEQMPKSELLRIVRDPNGVVVVDTTGKINGRGAYIKRDKEVLDKAKKSKILERILEVPLSDEVYLEIEKIINN